MRRTTLESIIENVRERIPWEENGDPAVEWFAATLGMMCLQNGDVHAVVVGIHDTGTPGVLMDFSGCDAPIGAHGFPPSPSRAGQWITFMVVFSDGSRRAADQSCFKPVAEA